MGPSISREQKEERKISRNITKNLRLKKINQKTTFKLLLLGTGDSGKSTITKQLRSLFSTGIPQEEILSCRWKVYENILFSVFLILNCRIKQDITFENEELAKEMVGQINPTTQTDITPDVAVQLETLWKDPGFQRIWLNRSKLNVYDNLEYYMKHIKRIGVGGKNYKPTLLDYIHCKRRTSSIWFYKLKLYNLNFTICDVGGQRGQRHKWISLFDDVLTVLYAISLAEFDEILYESENVNRREESLNVWKDIINRPGFMDIGFVLFLNKLDLFEKKLETGRYRIEEDGINLDYTDAEPCDLTGIEREAALEKCKEHTKHRFYSEVDTRYGIGLLTSHYLSATDSSTIETVLHNSKNTILNRTIVEKGMYF